MTKVDWQEQLILIVRQLGIAAVVIIALFVITAGDSAREAEIREETRDATLATACVLALPSDPELGRDADDVRQCYISYGIDPPIVLDPRGG